MLVPMLIGFGVLWNKIDSLSERVDKLEKQMRKVLKNLNSHNHWIRGLHRRVKKLEKSRLT